jgi:RsiW-degrading membrane proteinase PrsW (M82 family)
LDATPSQTSMALCAVAAALPVMFYLLVIWRLDRYEREPFGMVAATFVYGAIGGVIFGVIGSAYLMQMFHISPSSPIAAAFVAPLAEEPAKAGILFILLFSRHFDNTTDGLIYGAATGLGFAMTENFLYFSQYFEPGTEDWVMLVITRSAFTALMHCAASAVVGGFMGHFRYRSPEKQWIVGPGIGLAIAISIHAFFNGVLVVSDAINNEDGQYLALGIVPLLAIGLFVATQWSLSKEHKILVEELLDEAQKGLMPKAHAKIVPYHRLRRKSDWLSDYPTINKARYVELTTLLAFRKRQLQRRHNPRLAHELGQIRHTVKGLLERGKAGA